MIKPNIQTSPKKVVVGLSIHASAPLAVVETARPLWLRLIRQMAWLQLLSRRKGDCYEEKAKHYEIHKNGNWVD
jgi:hypothetical protein